jgi:cytochrome c peroxidase
LHNGSVKRLGQAVRLMGRHQLGVDFTEDQVSDIRSYLASLTGRAPF